jgi:hypothetical protein
MCRALGPLLATQLPTYRGPGQSPGQSFGAAQSSPTRRRANDLWTTLNCIQENITEGVQRNNSRRRSDGSGTPKIGNRTSLIMISCQARLRKLRFKIAYRDAASTLYSEGVIQRANNHADGFGLGGEAADDAKSSRGFGLVPLTCESDWQPTETVGEAKFGSDTANTKRLTLACEEFDGGELARQKGNSEDRRKQISRPLYGTDVQTERNGLTCVFKREGHRLVFVAGCPSSFKCLADQHGIAI